MRLTKRQLKRIIREEYSRLKRRGLIRESRLGRGQLRNVEAYCQQMGLGMCKVMQCDDGILNIPLVGFEDVRATDMQQMRTEIEE